MIKSYFCIDNTALDQNKCEEVSECQTDLTSMLARAENKKFWLACVKCQITFIEVSENGFVKPIWIEESVEDLSRAQPLEERT